MELSAQGDPKVSGSYTAAFRSGEQGGFVARASVDGAPGEPEIPRAEAGWVIAPEASEFASLQINRALLERLARGAGGEVVPREKLERFAAALPDRRAPLMENVSVPLWHQPAVFALALACFIGEWGLRRWKGLP